MPAWAISTLEVDILAGAERDATGRIANVVMMGILSTLEGMNAFPAELWLQALKRANSKPLVWAANYVAFNAGREIGLAQRVALADYPQIEISVDIFGSMYLRSKLLFMRSIIQFKKYSKFPLLPQVIARDVTNGSRRRSW
jgi:hypothetical protein